MDSVAFTIPSPGMSVDEVERRWGAPDSVEQWRSIEGDVNLTWKYPGFEVYSEFDRVWGGAITSRGWGTLRGLQVGDSAQEVYRTYGQPMKADGEVLIYEEVKVTVTDDIVREIYTEERQSR